jgi:hypothetical protein
MGDADPDALHRASVTVRHAVLVQLERSGDPAGITGGAAPGNWPAGRAAPASWL